MRKGCDGGKKMGKKRKKKKRRKDENSGQYVIASYVKGSFVSLNTGGLIELWMIGMIIGTLV